MLPVPALRALALALVVAAPAAVGCSALEPVTDAPEVAGPGAGALDRDDPSCKVDSDCASGEQCIDGLCQMQRCGTQAYSSVPPLGKRSYFAADRELLVVSDDATQRTLDGYEPTDGSFAHPSELTYSLAGRRVLDVASGNLTGQRPEAFAAVTEGSTKLSVIAGESRTEIELGFQPVAAAAGDVDGDAVDEVVVLGRYADVAVCRLGKGTCERHAIDGATGKDVVVADVDGDGREEPVVLADRPGAKSSILVMNLDHAATAQQELVELKTGRTLVRIGAGDLDGKSPSEIVALEDGTFSDTLRFFGQADGKLGELGTQSIASDAVDVYVGDIDADDRPELLVLERSGLEVFLSGSANAVTPSFKSSLTASKSPSRILMADLDGDSPAAALEGDPQLVPGPVVPLAVLVYPPYSRTWSDGTSSMALGNREFRDEERSSTVALKASLAVGFEAEFPGVVRASVMGRVEAARRRTLAEGQGIAVGDRFIVSAKPELEGPDNGVAVLACACYHAYTYRVEDPAGRMGGRGGDGKKMSLFVPVGGQTSLWSLKRYNALAARLGNLPILNVPYVAGDPASYPKTMSKLDGSPVPPDDLLFTTPRSYRTSDVAQVGWSLDVKESTAQTDAMSVGVSVRGSLKAGGVTVEGEVGGSVEEAYRVVVGRDTQFWGFVPPIRDDARTPEDEHEMHGFGFTPVVYRDRYTTADGKQGGYYVMTYTVTP